MVEISLIICTRNRPDVIVETLDCIKKQSFDKDLFEVLIMDQSTNDETKKVLNNYPDFKHIPLTSKGVAASRNESLKHANGNIIAFVDDDILFEENYLANVHEFFQNSELKPDVSGGKILFKYLGDKPEWFDGKLLGVMGYSDFGNKPKFYSSHPKHVPFTGSLAFKKSCLEHINGFSEFAHKIDTKITTNEDVILANELREKGFNIVYNPEMVVFHKIQQSQLTFRYYKKRFYIGGRSDAFTYYLLGKFKKAQIPFLLPIYFLRILSSLVLRFIKVTPHKKYYQKLRLYYNSGYIRSLLEIFRGKESLAQNENS